MKNVILPIVLLFLASCSVEKENFNEPIHSIDLNAIVEIDGCDVESYEFGNVGIVEVTNDAETLYVTIASAENFSLLNSKLQIANSESDFPTVGRGNLPPGQMEHNKDFEPNVYSHTFKFPLTDFEGCIYIASQSTFSNGEESVTTWAGDINVKYGNWSYFEYCIQECIPKCEDPIYTGPAVLTGSINYTDAIKISSNDEARKIFARLIALTGEYYGSEGDFRVLSRYSPTIASLVDKFSTLNDPFETYDLKTTYSYGTGECSGTIDLIITVIDNR